MSRTCSVVDSIDCEASSDVVTCWACGDDTCRACSSIVSRGQLRRRRFCFNCQDTRGVGRGEKRRVT